MRLSLSTCTDAAIRSGAGRVHMFLASSRPCPGIDPCRGLSSARNIPRCAETRLPGAAGPSGPKHTHKPACLDTTRPHLTPSASLPPSPLAAAHIPQPAQHLPAPSWLLERTCVVPTSVRASSTWRRRRLQRTLEINIAHPRVTC